MMNLKAPALDALKSLLKPLGYRKTATLFVRDLGGVLHLVEMQNSRDSTAVQAVFTVNVGIYVPRLVPADVRDARKPSVPSAHWRLRLGALSPEGQDLWWRPTDMSEAADVAGDIVKRLQFFALPVLDSFTNLKALTALWKSGRSPGLTERQRIEFLDELSRDSTAT
jgi:hypothetical protein